MPRKKKSETEKVEDGKQEVSHSSAKLQTESSPLRTEMRKAEREKLLNEEAEEESKGKELEKEAEVESVATESLDEKDSEQIQVSSDEIERKKKKLLEKAKKLAEKISAEGVSTEELKEKIKIKKRTDMLVPLEEYVKTGIYLGTRVVTPIMKPFVYRRRADGLAIFNTDIIDEKLKEGVEYLSKFNPEEVILVCRRQSGWRTAEMFSKLTGIRVFTKKYPAGILTNTKLSDFFENELTIIIDSWLDKNALTDTLNVHKKVLMICDTNNFSRGVDKIIIGNNKSAKSLGLIFYLLAKGYCKARGIEADIPDLDWWTSEEEEPEEIKKRTERVNAKFGV